MTAHWWSLPFDDSTVSSLKHLRVLVPKQIKILQICNAFHRTPQDMNSTESTREVLANRFHQTMRAQDDFV